MKKLEITAHSRKTLGKAVKVLRQKGITPVNLFGHGLESIALQIDTQRLEKILSESASSHFITLSVDKKTQQYDVLVKDVQREPLKGKILHVDFYRFKADEPIKIEVPIDFVGETIAEDRKTGLSVKIMRHLEIECLPGDIPEDIKVDISHLAQPEDSIRVQDLKPPKGITILNAPSGMIIKIGELHKVVVGEKAPAVEEAAPEEGAREG